VVGVCRDTNVLDKLEIRVPRAAQFRSEFGEMYSELAADPKGPFGKRGRHYALTGDLRMYGHDVILHLHCMHGEGNHKVELLDTGKRGFSFLVGEVERIFEIDPLKCGVMRVDCAADIQGVGVPWFHQRARVRWKQFANEMGELILERPSASASLAYSQMGKREIQTLYFGKRPNCYRIYDKVAEWRSEYRRTCGKRDLAALVKRMIEAGATQEDIDWRLRSEGFNPDADNCVPAFQEVYGVPESGYTLTRCERQIGGGEVPTIPVKGKPAKEWERLDSIAALKRRALDYNPFHEFEIFEGGEAEPSRENYSLLTYMAGMYLRERIQREGIQQTRSWINSHKRMGAKTPGRNAKKLLGKTFADFVPPCSGIDGEGLSSVVELYERYRNSVSKQMAA
jgi:hypothetical protein